MPQNKTVNTFENGLVKVDNPTKQPKNSYSFALNAVINDIMTDNTSIANEKAFENYFRALDDNYNIIGWSWLGKEEYVLFTKHVIGDPEFNKIVYINPPKNETRVLYDSLDLNFQDNYEIKTTYRINYKNQRIVYFVDGLNDDRLINVEEDSTALDISLLSIEANADRPIVLATVLDNGGNITSGQYFIGISYNLGDTFTTSVLSISNSISIANERYYNNITITPSINREFGATDGDIIPSPTNKAISIELDSLDDRYTSYNILVIKPLIDGTYSTRIIRNVAITTNTYKYTGNQGEVDNSITLNSLIVENIKYYASEAIIQKENRLIRGNVKLSSSQINYQEFANNIIVNYEINEELVFNDDRIVNNPVELTNSSNHGYDIPSTTYKKHSISPSYLANTGNNDVDNKSFMRDEVYSLGIGFELIDGTETPVFHIPGRINDILTSTSGTGEFGRTYTANWDTGLTTSGKVYWKDRNTALKYPIVSGIKEGGIPAYWRSSETYTDGYNFPTNGEQDTLGNSYIRHHKMPSDVLEPTYRTEITGNENANNTYTTYKLYKRNLALNFSNIIIPDEYKDLITKIKIFYTPRNETNKTVLSKGILYRTYQNEDDPIRQIYQPEGGLMSFNTIFEFISPEVNFKFKQDSLSGSRIKVNGLDKAFINYVGVQPPGSANGAHYVYLFNEALEDLGTGRRQKVTSMSVPYLKRVLPKEEFYTKLLDKTIFIDKNFVGSTEGLSLDFRDSQETSVIQLLEGLIAKPSVVTTPMATYYPTLTLPASSNLTTSVKTQLEDLHGNPIPWQEKSCYDVVYYISIINDNESLYEKIEDLEYINIHNVEYADPVAAISVSNGDTYIDMHHFKKTYSKLVPEGTDPLPYAPRIYHDDPEGGAAQYRVNEWGATIYGSFMSETDINIRMRREGEGIEQKYFPKTLYADDTINNYNLGSTTKEFYQIDSPYNIQFLKYYFANNLKQDDFIDNEDGTRYSTRIIYSDKQELEDKLDNYRIVRANNYRDLPLNRGPLTIFFTKQDKLYAITRDSLFDVFASNQTIKSENADNIVVGTGEFLSIEPVELISIDGGYGGTSSKFSLVESPFGYLFVDRIKNKCLLFNNDFKDINSLGLNENFKIELYEQVPDLEGENGFDDPANNVGIIATYDPELQRLIITKKDYKLLPNIMNSYVGKFDPNYDYQTGDVYLKDDKLFYVYQTSTEGYTTLVNTTNLSDFYQSSSLPINYTFTEPDHGTLVQDGSNLTYIPDTNYSGDDSFTINSNCFSEEIDITIQEVFYNVEMSEDFIKDDCPEGTTPETITYTVEEGTYSSLIDQNDANNQAQADIDTNGQNYANANGECYSEEVGNTARTVDIQKNNCTYPLVGSYEQYNVPANTFYGATLAEANALRDDNIAANAQNYANTEGTCDLEVTFTFEVIIYDNFIDARYESLDSRSLSFRFISGDYLRVLSGLLVSTDVTRDNIIHTYSVKIPKDNRIFRIESYMTTNSIISATSGKVSRIYKNNVQYGSSTRSFPGMINNVQFMFNSETSLSMPNIVNGDVVRLEHGSPPVITYYSAETSGTATKNNCSGDGEGSLETYTVAYGAYTSTVDQTTADNFAIADVAANKQTYANSIGTCTYWNDERTGVFVSQGCPEGYIGGPVTYTVDAHTYSAPSKAEANADADADIADNGQDFANHIDNRNCIPNGDPEYTLITEFTTDDFADLEISKSLGSDSYIPLVDGIVTTTESLMTNPDTVNFKINNTGSDPFGRVVYLEQFVNSVKVARNYISSGVSKTQATMFRSVNFGDTVKITGVEGEGIRLRSTATVPGSAILYAGVRTEISITNSIEGNVNSQQTVNGGGSSRTFVANNDGFTLPFIFDATIGYIANVAAAHGNAKKMTVTVYDDTDEVGTSSVVFTTTRPATGGDDSHSQNISFTMPSGFTLPGVRLTLELI